MGEKKSRDALQTKTNIITSATKLFAEYGFDGVSVDAIAKEADINKAMIYYYFKNKQTLYKAVVSKVLDDIYMEILDKNNLYKKPTQKLDSFIYTFTKYAFKNPHLSSLMLLELGKGGKKLTDDIFGGLKKIFFLLDEILQDGYKKGCFSKPTSIIIHFMIVGTINLFITTKELRQKVEDEFEKDLCKECDMDQVASYLSSSIQKTLKIDKGGAK